LLLEMQFERIQIDAVNDQIKNDLEHLLIAGCVTEIEFSDLDKILVDLVFQNMWKLS